MAAPSETPRPGTELVASPRETPWRSVSSRLHAPAGAEATLFQELESNGEREGRAGFTAQ